MTTLARTTIPAGTPPSVTLDSVTKVSADEFLLVYTENAVVCADVFKVIDPAVATILEAGFSGGEHINVIVQAGGSESMQQPLVTFAQLIIE